MLLSLILDSLVVYELPRSDACVILNRVLSNVGCCTPLVLTWHWESSSSRSLTCILWIEDLAKLLIAANGTCARSVNCGWRKLSLAIYWYWSWAHRMFSTLLKTSWWFLLYSWGLHLSLWRGYVRWELSRGCWLLDHNLRIKKSWRLRCSFSKCFNFRLLLSFGDHLTSSSWRNNWLSKLLFIQFLF